MEIFQSVYMVYGLLRCRLCLFASHSFDKMSEVLRENLWWIKWYCTFSSMCSIVKCHVNYLLMSCKLLPHFWPVSAWKWHSLIIHKWKLNLGLNELWQKNIMIYLKGLARAKIMKKSVILFWLLNMTIWCKHVHGPELQKFFNFSAAHSPVRLDIETKFPSF